ncbi:hypothetical protein R5R35_001791 [Gryllus longicercus]|uniref:AB hydrolase-1 domain-containing protein n=1 Tax=Gryllus longicercus TaxID=2509291 RepID=A0AAN9WEI7_9ORTH
MFNIALIIAWTNAVALGEDLCSTMKQDSLEVMRRAGFAGEAHRVRTPDGYLLTVHRLPAPPAPTAPPARRLAARKRRPVLLQHGLWSSACYWLLQGPRHALPYILSDAGFDVWMSNSRGVAVSQDHEFLSNDTDEYWDFSFHEMGVYDLPAVIEYVLKVTGREQLYYVGHSLGTTMFFVMASLRPDVAARVHFMVALAPVATVHPVGGSLRVTVRVLKTFLPWSQHGMRILKNNGISPKTVLHLMQLYLSGNFTMYDYGSRKNIEKYNTSKPLNYDIGNINLPVLLCYGTEDPFSTEEDMKLLRSSLGDVTDLQSFPLGHLDFVEGRIVNRKLFEDIVSQLH